jgi:hypothetical protein
MVARHPLLKGPFGLLAGVLAGLVLLSALLLSAPEASAQSGGRSQWAIGTGGGAVATGPPTAALYTNPAHLSIGADNSTFEVQLFDIRAYAGGDILQFDRYDRTFGEDAGTLTNAEEADVLTDWFGNGQRDFDTYSEIVPVAFAYRPSGKQWAVGFGVRGRTITEVETDRGVFDLFLVGADSNRTVPVNGRYRGFSTIDVTGSFSYSFESIPLSIGISPRLILGTSYADGTLNSEVTVSDSVLTHRFDYTARAAGFLSRDVYNGFNAFDSNPAQDVSPSFSGEVSGVGAGVDLGAVYEVQSDLYVSMSITDIGGIQWSDDAQTITPANDEFRFEGVELNVDRLQDEFDGDIGDYYETQIDSLTEAAYQEVERDRSSFSATLPTALQVNGTWSHDPFTLNGGATVGLNSTGGAVDADPVAHLGGEVRLGPIPIRAGMRFGGPQALTLAGGIGVDTGGYRFDVGISATPSTSTLGSGGRYAVGVSLATVQF